MEYIEQDIKLRIEEIDSQLKLFECHGGKFMSMSTPECKWIDDTPSLINKLKAEKEELTKKLN